MSNPTAQRPAISVRHVRKAYPRQIGPTLRDHLQSWLPGAGEARRAPEVFALNDVAFDIEAGESFGIVGNNGCGKSTLLKTIAGITGVSSGTIQVEGSVASLIEVGAGLHPDLSGRENIYLNASMLGLTRQRIESEIEGIAAFADLGEHLELPVRGYSSGMIVRLGFAIALHASRSILLIDEVLSVGDIGFQAKSYERIQNERRRGTTVVFVSHALSAVAAVCDRVLWLERGTPRMLGPAAAVLQAYQDEEERAARAAHRPSAGGMTDAASPLIVERVELRDPSGVDVNVLSPLRGVVIRIHFRTAGALRSPYFMISIEKQGTPLFGASMLLDGQQPEMLDGTGSLECEFESIPLLPGLYEVVLQVRATPASNYLERRLLRRFSVSADFARYPLNGEFADTVGRHSPPVFVPYTWRLSNDETDRE